MTTETALPTEPVSGYVAAYPSCEDLVRSGLIDRVLASRFTRIDDPSATVLALLTRMGRRFEAIFVASSTCIWPVTEAVGFTDRLGDHLEAGGNLRFLTGRGCNTTLDAVVLAEQEVGSGRHDNILVISVDSCPPNLNRLQNYAFFSDACTAIHVSNAGGTHEILSSHSGVAHYSGTSFPTANGLDDVEYGEFRSRPPRELGLLTLNCFDFVLRFKYGSSVLFDHLHPAPVHVHSFGADPFLFLALPAAPALALIHVESPPRHTADLLVRSVREPTTT
ncbi:hypothetical protein [Methylobacterium sp. SyP6R]|uniref:hypothetical protein n=1 Tax=Methylobacterium sp. SyP6R TaxID=2718876 RepID=UPI001F1E3E69|nr:hypothetical protein [Methylobacterium sp. SyP6R]MCF4130026.1 hypothetical protein [Methylobacterium sp. SyP6R]